MKYITTVGDQEFAIEIIDDNQVSVNGKVYDIDYQNISGQPVFSLLVNGGSFLGHVYDGDEDTLQVMLRGPLYEAASSCSKRPCPAWWSKYPWKKAPRSARAMCC